MGRLPVREVVVNGTFGKLGNMFSIIYSPDLLFQVTLTGQLTLLLLIERLELAGVRVVSANTWVALLVECHRTLKATMERIIKDGFGARFGTQARIPSSLFP